VRRFIPVEIFSSTSLYGWPVGWHDGKLVLAGEPASAFKTLRVKPWSGSQWRDSLPASCRTGSD
jgi:hypothetical protein